ncbi:hypothetical protein [Streptomyces ficellus]|uniref:Uncharacterized protein n=1 Tax=Streptomyces ficellus TaxID=1977088 RepID=A0A6I6FFR4_9ACTN|nr:hypothetical protein [Streptomyces ficellus]QGV81841.1 hypothetical protein EIZ62_28975 [Streptomyces ficellus]
MKAKAACGPERDPEFFRELDRVFAEFPDAADRYAVTCLAVELDVLKIDFTRQVGVSRVEDGRVVTEFVDRDEPTPRRRACCAWKPSAGCIRQCEE